ncbi:helix-turn-helix domain-containing protein [Chloroflexota bacterium]
MKQVELAQQLGISKSYLSMIMSGKRTIPEHLEIPFSELCEQNQLQKVPSKQVVAGSSSVSRSTGLATNCSQQDKGF